MLRFFTQSWSPEPDGKPGTLRMEPEWDPLRGDARFQEFLRQNGEVSA